MNIYFNTFLNVIPIFIELFCLIIKLYILIALYVYTKSIKRNKSFFYVVITLATGAFTNISLIVIRFGCPPFEYIPPHVFKAIARLEGTAVALQFLVLLFFFINLSSKKINNFYIKAFLFTASLITSLDMLFRSSWAIYTVLSSDVKTTYFLNIMRYCHQIWFLFLGFISLFFIYRNYRVEKINILQHHIFTLGIYFMLPYWIVKICESNFVAPTLNFSSTSIVVNFSASSITSIWFTAMIYYCVRKLLGLRFLDIKNHVQSSPSEKYNFIDDFKDVLIKLGTISSIEEVGSITKSFFSQAFDVPAQKVHLLIKECKFCEEGIDGKCEDDERTLYIEKYFGEAEESSKLMSLINTEKIMICDELELTHFYNQQGDNKNDLNIVMKFFQNTNLDIFLPVFSDGKLVSYILVDRDARKDQFYTDVERDEMLIYADYLGRVIYLLTHVNLKTMLLRERVLQQELYSKDKNINLIKKNIGQFLGIGRSRSIGVLTYKNKKFAYCNQAARQLLKIDLNKDKGLEVTQLLSNMGHDATVFMSSKRELITTPSGEQLIAMASPNLLKTNAVITVANTTISDLVKDDLDALKDYNKWDYLLALKTTEEGNILNQLIPSNTQTFLNCKVSLFEYAFTKNTLLLELASDDDVLAFAHVAHKISGRSVFEEVSLKRLSNDESLGLKLFGMNPIFNSYNEPGLFESLNGKGMLLISNAHFLSLNMQKKLLDFIDSGKYSKLKSDESIESDVFLVLSTTQNLGDLVSRGLFLKDLYLRLQKTAIWFSSLSTLPEDEFLSLAEGFRVQIIQSKVYQKMLTFSEQDKSKLLSSGCVSLYELKNKIQNILLKRTRKQLLDDEEVIDPAFNVVDLDLVEAARLGRHALKDPKLVALLMQKFKNNQAKVASFLGVNRSTISRKCAQIGIDSMVPRAALSQRSELEES